MERTLKLSITSKVGGRDCSEHRIAHNKLHAGFYMQTFVYVLPANSSLIACADIDAEQYD